ncbi:MAG TPA: pitrilysin family protein [Chitinophagales bacterium]
MSAIHKFVLPNGLRVIVQEDFSTPLVVVNVLYNVGSRDEVPTQTGFAHLFEHFMFEGSVNIPEFDTPLEFAGGESNAFTTNDFTNYYEILPAQNIDTALWLESDRMLSLAFEDESLNVQKRVVCEEFKEHYINQPYGDLWHKLSDLAYKVHPYRYPVIGQELSHIENAQMPEVKAFFKKYYVPNNAILVVCGGISQEETEQKIRHWFSEIPSNKIATKNIPQEPKQTEARQLKVEADVPSNAIYKAYKMAGRLDESYASLDILRDHIAASDSAVLYQDLVKEPRLMSSVTCYLTETIDEGLFVVEGKLLDGISFEEADKAIEMGIAKAIETLDEATLQKLKNKFETFYHFQDTNLMNRALNLAFFEMIGKAEDMFSEVKKYEALTLSQVKNAAKNVFVQTQCNTIFYAKKQQ